MHGSFDLLTSNPGAGVVAVQAALEDAVQRVIRSGHFVLGPEVEAFEREFAAYLGVGHCVGVANGTDAIHLGLSGLDVPAGALVATPSHTAVATVAGIELAGAVPLFLDVSPAAYTVQADALQQAVDVHGSALKAVVVVHLYGNPAPMAGLLEVARKAGLRVLEDCAQAHGARIDGARVGTLGDAACFSFYPTKNLGALGDGGAVVTADAAVASRVRQLRQYGWQVRNHSLRPGINSRLDEIQAAILRVRLKTLDADNAARRRLATRYCQRLTELPVQLPAPSDDVEPVFHQFVIQCDKRDALVAHLTQRRIQALVHYPFAVHQQPAYAGRVPALPLPNTEALVPRILSLPMYPQLTDVDADRVAYEVAAFFE